MGKSLKWFVFVCKLGGAGFQESQGQGECLCLQVGKWEVLNKGSVAFASIPVWRKLSLHPSPSAYVLGDFQASVPVLEIRASESLSK